MGRVKREKQVRDTKQKSKKIIFTYSTEERLQMFANLIVDRILEDFQKQAVDHE